jgi:tetratricopeptide (TPR) repeat protein
MTPELRERDLTYLRYTFKNDGLMYLSSSSNFTGMPQKFFLNNDIISLPFIKLKIESIDSINLVLIELIDNEITQNSVRYYLMREEALLDQFPLNREDYFVKDDDTIYFETSKVFARIELEKYNEFSKYLHESLGQIPQESDYYIFASFILDTDGKISGIRIHHHVDKAFEKSLTKALLGTEGQWEVPLLNGKKVKVLKHIEYLYRTLPFEGVETLLIGQDSKVYPIDFCMIFNDAVKLAYRNQYQSALDDFKKCLDLTSNQASTYYQMGLCYKNLNDSANYYKCMEEVKKSKLKYLLKEK